MGSRSFLRVASVWLLLVMSLALAAGATPRPPSPRPNILFLMTDDQGWGDVAFNGHPHLRTPNLDALAREGVRLDRFYAAAPVCSPTRGSALTGRHPARYGINWASEGALPRSEVTVAEALREAGYRTAHFGKWHLGQLSLTVQQGRRNRLDPSLFSPPWEHGFEVCFSTESSVPTFNPHRHPTGGGRVDPILQGDAEAVGAGSPWFESYWTGSGVRVEDPLDGDDSAILVDRALDFIRAGGAQPFFACVWFHAPHTPVAAGREDRQAYAHLSRDEQHFFGSISAMDAQIGRLRRELRDLGLAENTLLIFCSDNGPSYVHPHGSAAPFRGRKASLLEGGIRVPAVVEWPDRLAGGRVVSAPLVTSDLLPTLIAAAGAVPSLVPLDGIDILPLLSGEATERGSPIYFHSPLKNVDDPWAQPDTFQAAVQTNVLKLLTLDSGRTWALYDLRSDPGESNDLASQRPEEVARLREGWRRWVGLIPHPPGDRALRDLAR
jgi:arylsulfatase A-like enzyme